MWADSHVSFLKMTLKICPTPLLPPIPYRLKLKQHFRSTIQVNEMIIDLIKYSLDGRLWWLTVKFDTWLIFTYEMVDYDVGSDEKPIQHPRMQDVVVTLSIYDVKYAVNIL